MSGHSKWSTIKHKKGALDAKRGKLFSQLSKQIRVAVKEGASSDPKSSPVLRLALDKAKAANMPKDKIQKAIDRGMGKGKQGQIQEVIYEGFSSTGVGMLIIAQTDNTQRSSAEIKAALSRNNASLGSPGSANYLFERLDDGSYQANMLMPISLEEKKKLEKLVDILLNLEDIEEVVVATKLDTLEES